MPLLPLEQLLVHVDSKYRLVIIAAKRTKQLMRGNEPIVTPKSFKPTYTSLEEVASGRLTYETQPAEGTLAQELVGPELKPAWFRRLSAGETLAEGVIAEDEEDEEGIEESGHGEAPMELLAEPGAGEEPDATDLDAVGEPEASKDDA